MGALWVVLTRPAPQTGGQTKQEPQKGKKQMLSKLLRNEETNTALVAALSATVMVLVAKGDGPLSTERLLARVLPDPVARLAPRVEQLSPAPVSRIAA